MRRGMFGNRFEIGGVTPSFSFQTRFSNSQYIAIAPSHLDGLLEPSASHSLWNSAFNAGQRCSIGFRSGEFAGHSITEMLYCWKKACVAADVWIGALSCWNMYSPIVATWTASELSSFSILLTSSRNFKRPSFKVWIYSAELMPPFLNARSGPSLSPAKQLQTIIKERFPLKAGTKQSGWCFSASVLNTHTGCEFRPISTLLSSENMTLSQSLIIQYSCSFAHSKCALMFSGDRNGFFKARCFCIPASLSHRWSVHTVSWSLGNRRLTRQSIADVG